MEETQVVTSAAGTSEAAPAGTATEATAVDAGSEEASASTSADGTASSEATAAAATEEIPADETPDQRNARRQRQREARKQPPAPAPVETPEQIIARHEAQRAAQQQEAERQHRERMKYARYVGDDPADPSNPLSPTRYQQLWNEANTPIPDGDDKFFTDETRALVQRVNRARQQLQELNERRGMLQEVFTPAQQAARLEARDWLGNGIEQGIQTLGLDVGEIIASVKDPQQAIPQIVQAIGDRVRKAVEAEWSPKVEDLTEDLAERDAKIAELTRQLGGAAPQVERGGAVAGVNGRGSLVDRLIQQSGGEAEYAARAMRGDFAHLDLTK